MIKKEIKHEIVIPALEKESQLELVFGDVIKLLRFATEFGFEAEKLFQSLFQLVFYQLIEPLIGIDGNLGLFYILILEKWATIDTDVNAMELHQSRVQENSIDFIDYNPCIFGDALPVTLPFGVFKFEFLPPDDVDVQLLKFKLIDYYVEDDDDDEEDDEEDVQLVPDYELLLECEEFGIQLPCYCYQFFCDFGDSTFQNEGEFDDFRSFSFFSLSFECGQLAPELPHGGYYDYYYYPVWLYQLHYHFHRQHRYQHQFLRSTKIFPNSIPQMCLQHTEFCYNSAKLANYLLNLSTAVAPYRVIQIPLVQLQVQFQCQITSIPLLLLAENRHMTPVRGVARKFEIRFFSRRKTRLRCRWLIRWCNRAAVSEFCELFYASESKVPVRPKDALFNAALLLLLFI
ncbi:MAG: hypothetical protein EZS28_006743 [Streblomastix strix]|uniref:Uncharacterized protein n=1 Tax=Streblomastix strix TaxID=222440 RepID=A0A5J4WTN0_9EUKA|nr:MAG: hypothetical protein EZS28_006743 [Streblomastix strix]